MLAEVFQYIIATDLGNLKWPLYIFYFILNLVLFLALLPIGAVALRAAAKWIASIDVEFGEAYTTLLVAGLIAAPIFFCCIYLIPHSLIPFFSHNPNLLSFLPVMLIVQAPVIIRRLSVSFRKALLISLVMSSILIGIVAIGYVARLIVFA